MKKIYCSVMYEVTDSIMWLFVNNRNHWAHWWNTSEYYRRQRDRS